MSGGGARRDDTGSAVVEFVLLAVVLVVPFTYAVLCLFDVERAAFAVAAATREAGRAFVTSPDGAHAGTRADAAAAVTLEDHGLRRSPPQVRCEAAPCLTPGAQVTVELSVTVPLPLAPRLGGRTPASIHVRARHVEVVDRYREARP